MREQRRHRKWLPQTHRGAFTFAVAALFMVSGCASRMSAEEFERQFRVTEIRETVPSEDAQDTTDARGDAADRYFDVYDVEQQLQLLIHETAKSMPDSDRPEYFRVVRDLNADWVKRTMRPLLVRYYTRRQIVALTRFYSTPQGKSIARKQGLESGPPLPAQETSDTPLDRRVAAQRLIANVDMEQLYGGFATGVASHVPPGERESFYGRAHSNYRAFLQEYEQLLTRYYTRREIDAMDRFYTSPEGFGIISKAAAVFREFVSSFIAYIGSKVRPK